MNVGTKSLLIGVHQFLWHPITVLLAWIHLYGFPNWKELICIVIHDWGYWGSPNMDGIEGEIHPKFGAELAYHYLDSSNSEYQFSLDKQRWIYYDLCLYHSRHYAKAHDMLPSKLCWADKLSIKYDPWWLYLSRAWLSGELSEYRNLHGSMGENFKTHRDWYRWVSARAVRMGEQQSSEGISFHPQQTVRGGERDPD